MHNELKFSRDALGITTYLGLSWDRMLALMRKFTYFMMLTAFGGALMQEDIGVKFLLLVQEGQQELIQWVESSMKTAETAHNIRLPLVVKEVMEVEEDLDIICSAFSEQANFVLDITWYGNEVAKKITKELEVPYVKFDLSVSPILKFLDEFLFYRNATDAVIVFDNEKFIEQSLYYWLDTPLLRLATYGAESFTSGKIQKLRPVPQNVAIVAHTTEMEILVKAAIKEHAVTLPDRWILVFMDFNYTNFDKNLLNDSNITFLTINSDVCCLLKGNYDSCDCFGDYNVQENFGKYFANFLAKILIDIKSKKVGVFSNVVCNSTSVDGRNIGFFYTFLEKAIESDNLVIYNSSAAIRMKLNGTIIIGNEEVAKYSSENGVNAEPEKIKPIKKFYRIGTTHALPWSFQLKNETTGELYWTGYCIDLLQKLSEAMNFDYTIVTPKNGTFGEKINGIWDGIVGDLARGEIDLAFTAMVMTADKEEVIDFIPPYFEQSGISIVMRKPVRKTSLFKFMTVLKLEVWLSIVGALTSTGFLLWFLDKYSPYSGRNNKEAYPYSCREFTLKESFWFALTSFTPQGGGEAPKCLSGRTLVAGYWLFVVLMLATFTANLAAFLTVERMQTPVQSLEQLGRQSRINYTVVEGSETHKYFINMKFAEDTLYRMWKELTLNASIDDHRYRVWDYPIREQYGRILMAINDSMPVKDAEEGFRKVNEHEDADFAFIHDSSEIKYEVSRNCNLTEVGEVFAERPYAIAVQQGSRFQDDFSRNIIFLQRDRFFEFLQMKYWNHSNCRSDDSEGITLESLGGVFIATLFGLGLAMITLAFEVVYYKRKDAKAPKIKKVQPIKEISFITQPVTIGTDFKPVEKNMERMSHITLYPRARHRLNQPLPSVNN